MSTPYEIARQRAEQLKQAASSPERRGTAKAGKEPARKIESNIEPAARRRAPVAATSAIQRTPAR